MEHNEDQEALVQWIAAGLQIPEVRALRGDAGYLLNNMIAKYSLAADKYILSDGALSELQRKGVDLDAVHPRSRFYGTGSPFIYEHAVPAGVVRERLLEGEPRPEPVRQILDMAGPVAMILRSEDLALRRLGLRQKMPMGWSWGDDPLARYHCAGIGIADVALCVKGALCR